MPGDERISRRRERHERNCGSCRRTARPPHHRGGHAHVGARGRVEKREARNAPGERSATEKGGVIGDDARLGRARKGVERAEDNPPAGAEQAASTAAVAERAAAVERRVAWSGPWRTHQARADGGRRAVAPSSEANARRERARRRRETGGYAPDSVVPFVVRRSYPFRLYCVGTFIRHSS